MNAIDREIEAIIPRLRRYARALTGDSVRADDLVQDTLERAWAKLHLWEDGSDLRAWLFAIMHNVFVNGVRVKRLDVAPLDEKAYAIPAPAFDDGELGLRDLEAALSQLSPEQREVLLLVVLEEMRYEDVASALGVPVGTVMSRLFRARERLRILMAGGATVLRRVK